MMVLQLRELAKWETMAGHVDAANALLGAANEIEYQRAAVRKLEDALYRIAVARNLHSARAIATVALG